MALEASWFAAGLSYHMRSYAPVLHYCRTQRHRIVRVETLVLLLEDRGRHLCSLTEAAVSTQQHTATCLLGRSGDLSLNSAHRGVKVHKVEAGVF